MNATAHKSYRLSAGMLGYGMIAIAGLEHLLTVSLSVLAGHKQHAVQYTLYLVAS